MKKTNKLWGVLVAFLISILFVGKVDASNVTPQDLVDNYKDYTGFFEMLGDVTWNNEYHENTNLEIQFSIGSSDSGSIYLIPSSDEKELSISFTEPTGLDNTEDEMKLLNLAAAKLHIDGFTDEQISEFLNSIDEEYEQDGDNLVFENTFLKMTKTKFTSSDSYYLSEFSLNLAGDYVAPTTTTTTTTKKTVENPSTSDNLFSFVITFILAGAGLTYGTLKTLKKSN